MLKNCFKLHNCYKLQSPIYVKFYSNNVETVDLAYKIHDSHYVDPSKPPLVTFHSVLGSGSLWDGLVKDVQKETGRRVINVDARCHGNSPRTESLLGTAWVVLLLWDYHCSLTNTGEFAWKSHLPTLINKFESELAHFPRDLKGLQYFGPTLFICGASSQYVEKDDLPGIKEYFPQAEVIFIEGANHLVQFEKPKEFRETLCKFLNEK
ncbi:unnamed protein product [Leptidea sinapis]|uniref:sn-1-specific diacylglycerol lipase ABHD11 n=1 Tax=Leptidea sinapis TaxID=189913 RepID=A0A5E4QJC7_9NEOP|nr:unnamed protein product [Leptidea sinapis]